jgi:hypothetical protein
MLKVFTAVSRLFAVLLVAVLAVPRPVNADESEETADQKCVVSIERIWDRPAHAAFTDIIAFREFLYCTFREGSGHIPGLNGVIRVLRSRDRMNWESVAVLAEPHVDLRDPKLALTPDGRLMVNMGASSYHGSKRVGIESRVSFADPAGLRFDSPQKIIFPAEMRSDSDWLWRVTWHDGAAWACVQQVSPQRDGERALWLVRSRDGIHFEAIKRLDVEVPSETTLRFLADGTLVAMIRCEGKPAIGRIGAAKAPYTDWKFVESNRRFGGPNFWQLPGGAWLAGSRAYDVRPPQTQLWWLDVQTGRCDSLLTLPSSGDNSYPGFVVDEPRGLVYVSYYSSHEGKAAIYLATLRLDALESLRAAAN